MDPIDLIIQALLAGAAAGAKDTCKKAVKDAYEGLRSLLMRMFKKKTRPEGELILAKVEDKPEVWKAPLKDSLAEIGADRDTEIFAAAKSLLDLLEREGALKSTFTGDFRKAKGPVQIQKVDTFTQIIKGEPGTESGKGAGGKRGGGDGGDDGRSDKQQDFYLPDDLNLSEKETDCMLWLSARPEVQYPVCLHPAVTHAAGSAVALLATRAVGQAISDLRDRFNNYSRQIFIEDDADSDRLEEYTYELMELRESLTKLGAGTTLSASGGQNLASEVFGKLRVGSIILYKRVLSIQKRIQHRIATMQQLLNKISRNRRRDWRTDIGKVLKETYGEVEVLGEDFRELLQDVDSVAQYAKTDWDRDVDELWRRRCRPKMERKCGCSEHENASYISKTRC